MSEIPVPTAAAAFVSRAEGKIANTPTNTAGTPTPASTPPSCRFAVSAAGSVP
jgi:hypothetical protein